MTFSRRISRVCFTMLRLAVLRAALIQVDIEQIEHRRPMNPEMDAIYLLSPLPHIVDCLMADLERRRYKKAFLIWTSVLDGEHRMRIMGSPQNQQMIADMSTLTINFFPREHRLVTFRDPYSFPLLYHTDCNDFVPKELQNLAQKVNPHKRGMAVRKLMRLDYWCMYNIRRVSDNKILQTSTRDPRSKCDVLMARSLCSRRARHIQEVQPGLATSIDETTRCSGPYGQIYGSRRADYTRIYIPSYGARLAAH